MDRSTGGGGGGGGGGGDDEGKAVEERVLNELLKRGVWWQLTEWMLDTDNVFFHRVNQDIKRRERERKS
jgi:hypothetical protein